MTNKNIVTEAKIEIVALKDVMASGRKLEANKKADVSKADADYLIKVGKAKLYVAPDKVLSSSEKKAAEKAAADKKAKEEAEAKKAEDAKKAEEKAEAKKAEDAKKAAEKAASESGSTEEPGTEVKETTPPAEEPAPGTQKEEGSDGAEKKDKEQLDKKLSGSPINTNLSATGGKKAANKKLEETKGKKGK